MKIDMHCHVIGNGRDINQTSTDVYSNADDNQHWFTWVFYHMLQSEISRMEGSTNPDNTISTDEYFDLIYKLFSESAELEGLVLLALDAVYENGMVDTIKTDLWVSNEFLSNKVRKLNEKSAAESDTEKRKRFFLGASVNPNQPHAADMLRKVIDNPDTVLLKWIPSAQHIHVPAVPEAFYRILAESNLPLLCHVGPEDSFPEGIRNKEEDNFIYLKKPLDLGVKVIAAHCASPVFPLKDTNRMEEFQKMMAEYNKSPLGRWF